MASKYTVRLATTLDTSTIHSILSPLLVSTTKPPEGQARDSRILTNNITLAIKEVLAFVLTYEDIVVGVQLLQDRQGTAIIIHSNILEEHKRSRGTIILLNEVVNVQFKDRPVYTIGVEVEFKDMVELVGSSSLYKLKDDVAQAATRYLEKEILWEKRHS